MHQETRPFQNKNCLQCERVYIRAEEKPPKNYRQRKFCTKSCSASYRWAKQNKDRASRFWGKVRRLGAEDCWLWIGQMAKGTRGKTAYGVLRWDGKMTGAHRVAFMLSSGDILPGMHVLHSCDNPPCCNPAHLRMGTHRENMDDVILRHRQLGKARDENKASKMSMKDYSQLLQDCISLPVDRYGRVTKGSVPALAAKWGVSIYIVKRAIARARQPFLPA